MSNDIVTYVAEDMSEDPIVFHASEEMAQRAWELHNELLRLGKLAQEKRIGLEETWRGQGKVLKEFWDNPDLCRAFGCESWAEYMGQDDVEEALASIKEILGLDELSKGQRSKISRLLIHSFLSGENLLKPGKFSRYFEALPDLEEKKRQIEAAETDEEKVEAFQEYQESVKTYGEMPTRQVRQIVATHRPPPCAIRENDGDFYLYDTESGERVMKVNPDDPASQRVADCLSGGRQKDLLWSIEGIHMHSGSQVKLVSRWERSFSPVELRRYVERIPNCQEYVT